MDYIVLQEYMPPKSIEESLAAKRRADMQQAVLQAFQLSPDKVIVKQRQSQKGLAQYEKLDHTRNKAYCS